MTHQQVLPELSPNLDDLKVRDPNTYKQLEREANILKIKSDIALAHAPIGMRRMERMR